MATASDEIVSASEKSPSRISDFDVSIGRTSRTTNRKPSAPDPDEDQTDRLENQKVREVSKENQMFNHLDLEVGRKIRGEILRARFSMQKSLEEERADFFFEQKARDEELAALLQNQSSRFSNLAHRLLEQKVREPILQSLEEEQEDLFSIQTDRFQNHSEKEVIHMVLSLEHMDLFSIQTALSLIHTELSL